MKPRCVQIIYDGKSLTVNSGEPLSLSLHRETPCGGHGKCGKCKAKVTGEVSPLTDAERTHLTKEEIANGIRLLCHTYPFGAVVVTSLSESTPLGVLTDGKANIRPHAPMFSRYGIALDMGTTTLAGRLYDRKGNLLASAGTRNPQTVYGADIISRIEHAKADKTALSCAIRQGISTLIGTLTEKADISPSEVDVLVLCGNTTMQYLLTETDTEPLSHAPFSLTRPFGEWLTAEELSLSLLSEKTRVYLSPVISAFVGSDTVCAVLATELIDRQSPALLVDIGTNGEIALWDGELLRVTSTSAGPAFEGVGITAGMRGEDGAIDRIKIEGDKFICHTVGSLDAQGICGSGLIDAVGCLLNLGLLDESGYLEEGEIELAPSVLLTQKDIRQLQLAKSAIFAGMSTLLREATLSEKDLKRFLLCGAFGTYLDPKNATRIGLFPSEWEALSTTTGNSALDGASLLLLNRSAFALAEDLCGRAYVVDLATNPVFSELFMSGMLFPEQE